jgi:plasmid stability protein
MVKTQLQLDDETYDALRGAAHKQRKSMSAVAREILRSYLVAEKPTSMKALTFLGAGASGRSDISVRHDEALAEDFR